MRRQDLSDLDIELGPDPFRVDEVWEEDVTIRRAGLNIAQGLKACRKKLGLTQSELANVLNCTERSVADYEAGRRSMPAEKLGRLLERTTVGLHEPFCVLPDQPTVEDRAAIIDLAFDLVGEILGVYPEADRKDVEAIVKGEILSFPDPQMVSAAERRHSVQMCVQMLVARYGDECREDFSNRPCTAELVVQRRPAQPASAFRLKPSPPARRGRPRKVP
ncbi:helix-turn-helix domain-containing protein [Paracoccus pantotrophus]|uniref:helix-turn-helix domain-containing protein n=1 Tax=Paracoccus pantotrophus TaxID=82367 RepID=UPI0015F0CFB7|nr:helix-turn-helix transcriptional regulator [Paracoccus pantotrophus]